MPRRATTAVLTQSEGLPVAEQPLDHPLYGTFLDLEIVRDRSRRGRRDRDHRQEPEAAVNKASTISSFVPDDGSTPVPLTQGDIAHASSDRPISSTPTERFPTGAGPTASSTLYVADSSGRTGTVEARLRDFSLALAGSKDPVVQEFALVSTVSAIAEPFPHTRILLQTPLLNCYDRTVTTVNANVGPATAGVRSPSCSAAGPPRRRTSNSR